MRTILFLMLMSTVTMSCKKTETTTGGSDKPTEGSTAPASALPALTADPDPGAITAAETPPLDAVKFRMLAKRTKGGWPTFDAYNLGTKPIGWSRIRPQHVRAFIAAYEVVGPMLADWVTRSPWTRPSLKRLLGAISSFLSRRYPTDPPPVNGEDRHE